MPSSTRPARRGAHDEEEATFSKGGGEEQQVTTNSISFYIGWRGVNDANLSTNTKMFAPPLPTETLFWWIVQLIVTPEQSYIFARLN